MPGSKRRTELSIIICTVALIMGLFADLPLMAQYTTASLSGRVIDPSGAAVTGGMYEIGGDLPLLGSESKRLALVENRELIDMNRLVRAALPIDLMTFRPSNEDPSVFFLREAPGRPCLPSSIGRSIRLPTPLPWLVWGFRPVVPFAPMMF